MALLSPQQVGITGTTPTYSASNATDTVAPDDRAFLIVKNASGVSTTVTTVIPGSTYGQARPDVGVSVPAGGERWVGPFTPDMADPTTGLVSVTTSPTTSITNALVRV